MCLPWEMLRLFCASQPLRLQLAAWLLTAALSGGAAWLHATREVVAGKDDLEVIGDEGAHVAVGVADFVLRLVGLHHSEVSLRALRRRCRRAVLLPPRRGKLRFLFECGTDRLLNLGFRVGITVAVGTIGPSRLLINTVNHALLGA